MSQGPVDTTASPHAHWQTLPLDAVSLADGFWAGKQAINSRASLRHGFRQLDKFGNFNNLRLAAGTGTGEYRTPVFMDSDVYKWLEAVAYDLAIKPDAELRNMAEFATDLIEAAQGEDGYLNSYWQVVEPERRWQDLPHGHELYCAGHLFQAAVAYHRATGSDRLLNVSRRLADYIDSVFGTGKHTGTPGHPEIEMALVELYRETGERRYLGLAGYFVDQRGQDLLGMHRLGGPAYYQDHAPVREADTVEGHAVRQLYLTTGVADIYLETGERALLDALMRQWQNMVSRKLFITGGVGSQHAGEAFGEPYELPNERCYCETCAQIASIMWNWRMLLATGEARFADLLEQTLYNGFLSGVSLDGSRYFYVNPLLSHGKDPLLGRKHVERPEWHSCACCPPNVMRMLASLGHYVATVDRGGVQIHQYTPVSLSASLADGRHVQLAMQTSYPWSGDVTVRVEATDGSTWRLQFRIPAWCGSAVLRVNDQDRVAMPGGSYAVLERAWRQGDVVTLELSMTPVLMTAHPRIDPTRSSVALQRGPLVYCLEEVDQDDGVDLLDVRIDVSAPLEDRWQADLLDGVVVVQAAGRHVPTVEWQDSLYRPMDDTEEPSGRPVTLTAIPYYAWANRGPGKMRVWIPRA